MTILEILEQAKSLSQQERKQLMDLLQELEAETETPPGQTQQEHWGQSLKKMMDEIGTIELLYPEIEDPVEWVKHLRNEQRKRRLGDWGENE